MTLDNKINDLTEKIKEGRLTRRDFFKLGALVGGATLANYACGNKNVSSPTDPTPPNGNGGNPVNLHFTFRKATGEPYPGNNIYTKTVTPGSPVTISPRTIPNNSVAGGKIAIYNEGFGSFEAYGSNGATIIAPSQDTNYEAVAFGIGGGGATVADYDILEREARLTYGHKPTYFWENLDAQTGPREPLKQAVDQIANAMNIFGSLNYKKNGDFSIGYGDGDRCGGMACHGNDRVYVDAEQCTGNPRLEDDFDLVRMYALAEIFEQILGPIQNPFGGPTHDTITSGYNLNRKGEDLVAFAFAARLGQNQ